MRQRKFSITFIALIAAGAAACGSEAENPETGSGARAATGGNAGSGGSAGGPGGTGGTGGVSGSSGAGAQGGMGAAGGTGAGGGAGALGGAGGAAGNGGVGGGGTSGAGGTGAAGGTGGSSGSLGTGGAGGGTPVDPTWPDCPLWPASTGNVNIGSTQNVSGTFDGKLRRYVFGGDYSETIFELADGATIQNVILAGPAADGIHCKGDCTLKNIWWEDVGEDAATFEGNSSTVATVDCGGARKADDKVFQHNGAGRAVIRRFYVQDFGKLYRSCGNCDNQYARHAEIENVIVKRPGSAIAGVNENYGDAVSLRALYVFDPARDIDICQRYTGNNTGAEPTLRGTGPDATHCLYSAANVFFTAK